MISKLSSGVATTITELGELEDAKIERIIVAGNAGSLPDFPIYLANKFNLNVEVGNAWRNVSYSPDRQNELLTISSQFTVAVGLAVRHV